MSKKLEVRLLGKFEVNHDGKTIAITSRPAQSLFAYLILSAGTAHRREKLAGMLWPDSLEETARDNLRHALWRMRKALEAASSTRFLYVNDLTISFKESPDYWLDVSELESLSEDASADKLMSVLSEYQGELLPGFYEEWVFSEREHLSSVFEHHMARLMSLLQEEKRWLDILDWGERWIKLGRRPEPAYRVLMMAHAAKGDMSKVATTYQRCMVSLKEFGVEPSKETRALYERLKAGRESFETVTVLPSKEKQGELPKTNLPIPLSSFVGRERETEEVNHLLSSTRLLTLTGTGGIGKTRLAIQLAHESLRSFIDGVWWVELAPLMDEALVSSAIAQVLGLREAPDMTLSQSIQSFLREKQALLILDNCEHLIAACAHLADKLLSQCANLKILTTSREALGITGETTLHVPALSFPTLANLSQIQNLKEFESIQLFVERAAAVRPDLALTQQNAFAVAQICQRLDGIPLAIELAAARVKLLSLEEIAHRLDDRFSLLTHGSRTALPRHQTLHALIDWSHDLLPEPEKKLFQRLSVFAGGFTLDAAEKVAAGEAVSRTQVIDLLGKLITKSLVVTQARSENANTRYRMLETIREYAREKLDESTEAMQVQNRHLDFFMRLAEEGESKLQGVEQGIWLERFETEHDNLRAALRWGLEHSMENGLRLAGALWLFWFMHAHFTEGRQWYDEALFASDGMSSFVRVRLLVGAAAISWARGDIKQTTVLSDESLALSREHRNTWGIAMSLHHLGLVASQQGNFDRAQTCYEEGLVLSRKMGYWSIRGYLDSGMGMLAEAQGDYERARAYFDDCLTVAREHEDWWLSSYALENLGYLACRQGNYYRAEEFYTQALRFAHGFGDKRLLSSLLGEMGIVAQNQGNLKRAVALVSASETIREEIGSGFNPVERVEHERMINAIRSQLGEATFNQLWLWGHSMMLEQAIDFALKETEI